MRRSVWIALVAVVLGTVVSELWAGKGGGKPGGGGPPPDPAIACWYRGGNEALLVMNDDGSNQTAVVDGIARGPSWTPDGTRIVYWAEASDGTATLCRAELATGGVEEILAWSGGLGLWAACSPAQADGSYRIAFTAPADGTAWRDVYVVDSDGLGLVRATSTSGVHESRVTWSPDGTNLAFDRGNGGLSAAMDIIVLDLATGAEIDLTDAGPLGASQVFHPGWAKTGGAIAVIVDRKSIWAIDPDDPTHPAELLAAGTLKRSPDLFEPSWSPDDGRILFRAASGDLYVMNADGSGPSAIAKGGVFVMADWRR